jgi:hypothetical protein
MTSILYRILLPENLNWAWKKAKNLYQMSDGLYDKAEVAAFELDLESQLNSIEDQFRQGAYQLSPLRLLPQPKKPDKDGRPRMRQSFHIAVRDQVAWIAIVNGIGAKLDILMPAWSYGHRLYRAAWYEESDDGNSKLTIGPYRHANGQLYRKFKHSWPLFRRHVVLTARRMGSGFNEADLPIDELRTWRRREEDGLSYLGDKYWNKRSQKIFHATFDLTKFYPSISSSNIIEGLKLLPEFAEAPHIQKLIASMLNFRVEHRGLSSDFCDHSEPKVEEGPFDRIPTGLMVAGFLSNIAMLPIDKKVNSLLVNQRDVAHFRFVDDHVVLAYNFETLCEWIRNYEQLLESHGIKTTIAEDKYHPEELNYAISREDISSERLIRIEDECLVDPKMPTKLMTRTLNQISTLAGSNFDILTDPLKMQRLEQLEWLLLADIPDTEVRSDTRVAFAAGGISSLAPRVFISNEEQIIAAREGRKRDAIKLEKENNELWKQHIRHYFKLLMHSFKEHPDKVRIFIRLLTYCRATGHNGFPDILTWMKKNEQSNLRLHRNYLVAITLQVLAKQLMDCAASCSSSLLLHIQRKAALEHIKNIAKLDISKFVNDEKKSKEILEFFQIIALNAFRASVSATIVVLQESESEVEVDVKEKLVKLLKEQSTRVDAFDLRTNSKKWKNETGYPIGVWTYLAETATKGSWNSEPGSVWKAAADFHDPNIQEDWLSIRRFPLHFPDTAWSNIRNRLSKMPADDAGWLLDAARANPRAFGNLPKRQTHVRTITEALKLNSTEQNTLHTWVTKIRNLTLTDPHDPRTGEWTALEVIRQLLRPVLEFGKGELGDLIHVHPGNIIVPKSWFSPPSNGGQLPFWTWESWRFEVQNKEQVEVNKLEIADYRFRSMIDLGPQDHSILETTRILRILGLVLLGLLRKDFTFPGSWNIRGHERDIGVQFRQNMEHLVISSKTLAILESCLLPRSQETVLMFLFPASFGTNAESEPNDISFDPPYIETLNSFDEQLQISQKILVDGQIAVMKHKPRQVVPISVGQLGRIGLNSNDELERPDEF